MNNWTWIVNTTKIKCLFGIILLLVLSGCQSTQPKLERPSNVFDELESKIAFAQGAKLTSSPWAHGEPIKLRIVAPIYQTAAEKRSSASRSLAKTLQFLAKNQKRLDALTGLPLSTRFSSIDIASFELDKSDYDYVPAIFNNAYADETALNSVFNVALPKRVPAEIGFYIDSKAWKDNIISLYGYKTIKTQGKERNSTWFHYTKNLTGEDNKAKVDALLKMTSYALAADIREYASIDRDAVMKFNNKAYVVERANKETVAYVYKDRLKLLEAEIERSINGLDKEQVLLDTQYAQSIHIDNTASYAVVNRLRDFESSVELLSLNNANQRSLIWSSKKWDEYAKQAFYLPQVQKTLLLTDLFLTVRSNKESAVLLQIPGENIRSLRVMESKQQAFYVDDGAAFMLDLNTNKVSSLTSLGTVNSLLPTQTEKGLYVVSADNNLNYFDLKQNRLTTLARSFSADGMRSCEQGRKLLYWQGEQAFIFDRATVQRHPVSTSVDSGAIVTADCATTEAKFALMFANGKITQFDLATREVITALSGDYDAYDQQNAGYIVKYIPDHKYVYGGKGNIKIRPSTTENEIKLDYDRRLSRVDGARSWLEKSSIKQVIFAEPLSTRDITLYKQLFIADMKSAKQAESMLRFLNEEQVDPLLAANKPGLFNRLSSGLSVIESKNIMLVKQQSSDEQSLYTVSIPNWQSLGFKVDKIDLGRAGFESKIYRRLNNDQLTGDIENITLPHGLSMLVTTLTNGSVLVESLSREFEFSEDFIAHSSGVTAAAIDSKRELLATAGSDGLIKIWRLTLPAVKTGWVTLEQELKGYAGNVSHLEFIDNEKLISSGQDQTIKLWDLKTGRIANTEMLGHTDTIRFANYDDSLQQIVSGSDDGTVRIWDPDKGEQVRSFKGNRKGFVAGYDINANLVAYNKAKNVLIKNIVSGDTIGKINYIEDPSAVMLGFSGSICYLIYPNKIAVYKVSSGQLINNIPLFDINEIKKVLITNDDQDLYIMGSGDIAVVNVGRYALSVTEN